MRQFLALVAMFWFAHSLPATASPEDCGNEFSEQQKLRKAINELKKEMRDLENSIAEVRRMTAASNKLHPQPFNGLKTSLTNAQGERIGSIYLSTDTINALRAIFRTDFTTYDFNEAILALFSGWMFKFELKNSGNSLNEVLFDKKPGLNAFLLRAVGRYQIRGRSEDLIKLVESPAAHLKTSITLLDLDSPYDESGTSTYQLLYAIINHTAKLSGQSPERVREDFILMCHMRGQTKFGLVLDKYLSGDSSQQNSLLPRRRVPFYNFLRQDDIDAFLAEYGR